MTTTIMCKLMWFKFVSWDFRPAASGAVEMFYGARTNERRLASVSQAASSDFTLSFWALPTASMHF